MDKQLRGKLLLALTILIIASVLATALSMKKPRARKKRPTTTVPVVRVIQMVPGSYPIEVEAYGNVIPSRQIDLLTEVEGRAIQVSPELVPGGFFKKGDLILKIEPQSYSLQVKEKESAVASAERELEVERAQQKIAKKQWEFLKDKDSDAQANRSLALRKPHLKSAIAMLEAARGALGVAQLSLERTSIRSPFNSLVIQKSVSLGQVVSRQRSIATLVDTDNFWVQVSIPQNMLRWLTFPDGKNIKGSTVNIMMESASRQGITRQGYIFKLLGDLDPRGRMARVLINLADPLSLKNPSNTTQRVLLGSYVKATINAGSLDNIFSVPREALREGNRIWLLNDEDKLVFMDVDIKWSRKEDVLVSADISDNQRLITSRIQTPLPLMQLKTEQETNAGLK
jgi:RND family efflux transporter MFP subunit